MRFNGWNIRKVLLVVGFLPFVIGGVALLIMLVNPGNLKAVNLIAVAAIFTIGFFMVSLRRSLAIDSKYLKKYWHVFFILRKERKEPLSGYIKIEVDTGTAAQGMGSVSSSSGRIAYFNYYRICFKHKRDSNKDYYVSEHEVWEVPKGFQRCFEVARLLSDLTSLKLEFSEQFIEEARRQEKSLACRGTQN